MSKLIRRSFSLAVKYSKLGHPVDVLKLEALEPLSTNLKENEVLLKFIAAPMNPSDFNMIEGVYGVKATLPAVGGNEGVAKVEKVGSKVSTLALGDWVIPAKPGFGTWRQEAITPEDTLVKVPNDIEAAYAATISVNPSTSYRLLRDFASLKQGDVILQNAANSMVGVGVIQMARELGIRTVNVIRSDRPDAQNQLRMLTNLGGDVNIFEKMLNTPIFKEIMADLPPCTLAFNAVGGEPAVELARALAPNGTMVTYGGMSRQAPVLPLDLITDKQLKLRGFWMAKWSETHSKEERQAMYEDIAKLIRDKQLSYFFELHDMDDFPYALKRATKPFALRKVLLQMDYPDRLAEHDKLTDEAYEMFQFPLVGN